MTTTSRSEQDQETINQLQEEIVERAAEGARLQDEMARLSAAALAGAAGLVALSRENETLVEQRDALADALESARSSLLAVAMHSVQPLMAADARKALPMIEAALRKAGR